MSSASRTCETISKGLTYMSLEFEKEKREKMGQKILKKWLNFVKA